MEKMGTTSLTIEGMTCAACAQRVSRALQRVDGVASAQVNLATERAEILGSAPLPALLAAVDDAGYSAHLWQPAQDRSAVRAAEA